MYCEQCRVYCELCTVYCELCTVNCVLCSVNCVLCTVYSVLADLVSGWLGGWLYFCLAGLVAGWLGDWLAVWLDDWSRATRKKEFYPAARGTLQLHVQTPVFRKKPRPLRRTVYKQADWQQHQPEKIPDLSLQPRQNIASTSAATAKG